MGTISAPDAEWIAKGQKIYGILRQHEDHAATIARMVVIRPETVDWILQHAETWKRTYETR